MAFSKPYDPEQSRKNDAHLPYRHDITDIAGLHGEKNQQIGKCDQKADNHDGPFVYLPFRF